MQHASFQRMEEDVLPYSDAVIVNDCAAERSNVTSLAEIDGDATTSE